MAGVWSAALVACLCKPAQLCLSHTFFFIAGCFHVFPGSYAPLLLCVLSVGCAHFQYAETVSFPFSYSPLLCLWFISTFLILLRVFFFCGTCLCSPSTLDRFPLLLLFPQPLRATLITSSPLGNSYAVIYGYKVLAIAVNKYICTYIRTYVLHYSQPNFIQFLHFTAFTYCFSSRPAASLHFNSNSIFIFLKHSFDYLFQTFLSLYIFSLIRLCTFRVSAGLLRTY